MYPGTPFDSSDLDGFRLEIGPDTYYITVQDQHQAVSLEEKGLRRPIEISTTRASTVYFAVPHNDHLAPVCLRLSPFTLGQVPGQTFYCIYFWYTECCHLGPGLDKIAKGVQRVYRVYFAGGPCDFNDANCQPLPSIDVEEGTPCYARAQLAFDRLIRQHQPLEKWEYDEVSTGLKPKRRSAKTRKPKRSSATLPGEDDEPRTAPPSPVPDPAEPKQGSVLALCAKISASQSVNDTQSPKVSEPGKTLFNKLSDGLIKAGKSEIIAGMICITTDGVELHLPAKTILLENAARTWAVAKELERGAAELSWILRFLSTCMRLVQRKLLQFVPDDQGSEEKKRCRWEHGVLMLNRVVNKLGPMGLRLYDAAAVKNLLLTSCADFSEENRHSIADDAVHRLLEWNEKDGQEETSVKRRHKSKMKQQVTLPGTLRVLFPPRALTTLYRNETDYAIICEALALPNFIDTQVHSEFVTLQDLGGGWGGDGNSPPTIRPRRKRLRPEDDHGSPPRGESDAEVVQPQFDGQSHCVDTFTSVSLYRVSSPPASQPRSRPNDQVHPLDHSNANSGPLSTGDEAEGANLETRTFTPINTSQHAGPVASLPANASAAPSSLQRTFMGLIPSFQPSVRAHPPSSGATLSFNDKQRRPEPTGCRPGSDRSGEPAGADWHADQSQVIASPESPSPMGEVVGNRFQAASHPALVRTGDGGSSQAHTFNAEDVGEQQVTNSTALGDTQPPSVPAKARSGYGQARENQSDDDHSDSRSIEDQSDKSSEGQFDDETVEEAAPTRPRKRQRRDVSRGPPHLLLTPPASQSQTQPNISTRTTLHQPVPPSTHTVTDRSPVSRLEILSQAAGSPTTQFQTWPNNGVHTAENNGNLSFLGGRQDGGVNSQEIPQPGVVEQAALPPDNTERAAHSGCVNPGLVGFESALDLFASICAGQEGEPTSQRNESPTGPTQPPDTANDTRRHPEPADHDGQFPGAVALGDTSHDTRLQPSAFSFNAQEGRPPGDGVRSTSRPEHPQHSEPVTSLLDLGLIEPGLGEQEFTEASLLGIDHVTQQGGGMQPGDQAEAENLWRAGNRFESEHGKPTSLPESMQMPPGTINIPTVHLNRHFQPQSDNGYSLLQFDTGNNERVVDVDLMFSQPCDNHFTGFQPDSLQGAVDLELMFDGGSLGDAFTGFLTNAGENNHQEGTEVLGVNRFFRGFSSSPSLE